MLPEPAPSSAGRRLGLPAGRGGQGRPWGQTRGRDAEGGAPCWETLRRCGPGRGKCWRGGCSHLLTRSLLLQTSLLTKLEQNFVAWPVVLAACGAVGVGCFLFSRLPFLALPSPPTLSPFQALLVSSSSWGPFSLLFPFLPCSLFFLAGNFVVFFGQGTNLAIILASGLERKLS